ncbi:MAG: diguanylate cyclase, partial [Candidatus Omnitrophica bacterium]|nr:diguanylate cyclase [Candidatus Omnitrophota bacterium]
ISGMKKDHAVKYAERLRNMVGSLEFKTDKGEIIKVAMSAGIITIEDAASENPNDLIKAADKALYDSKNSGRDKLSVFSK